MSAAPEPSRPVPRIRRCWPLAALLLGVPLLAELFVVDEYDTSDWVLVPIVLVPMLGAVALAARAIGGRRGALAGVALLGLLAYWAWWFGWGLNDNISGFSLGLAAEGLGDASAYLVGLAVYLWPLVLLAAVVVGWLARRRRWRVWSALGLLTLALVVAAFPSGGSWSDGCNDLSGATPLITRPFLKPLMNAGVGVLPGGFQTQVLCLDVGDREWKPFWLGGDGLPPGPRLGRSVPGMFSIPTRLYHDPKPLPGRRFSHVVLAYTEADHLLVAMVVTPRLLPTPLQGDHLDIRANGIPTDSKPGLIGGRPKARCYTALWRGRPGFPPADPAASVRVTYEWHGRLLAAGTARIERFPTWKEKQPFFRQFGCE